MQKELDRVLVAFGCHVAPADRIYWAYALSAVVASAVIILITGMWGLGGITLALFSFFALAARKRYEASDEHGG